MPSKDIQGWYGMEPNLNFKLRHILRQTEIVQQEYAKNKSETINVRQIGTWSSLKHFETVSKA